MSATTVSRDAFLEKKILMLDKRLTLVEKFVELRFHDTFKTFTGSHESKLPKKEQFDGSGTRSKKGVSAQDETVKRLGKRSRIAKTKEGFKVALASVKNKELGDRVTRSSNKSQKEEDEKSGANTKKTSKRIFVVNQEMIVDDYKRPRYNIRRSKRRRSDDDEESLCQEVKTEVEPGNHSGDDGNMLEVENNDDIVQLQAKDNFNENADIEEPDSYFMFPQSGKNTSAGEDRNDENNEHPDLNDRDWSGAEDVGDDLIETDDEDESVNEDSKAKERRRSSSTKSNNESTRKRGRPSIPKSAKVPRKYPSASSVTLNADLIARGDPTRQECPMCHQHIKIEYYPNHLETHMKERHLKCPHCDNRYFNNATLRKHMRLHDPSKYGRNCRLCQKQFFQSGKLLAHERFCVKKTLESNKEVDPEIIEDLKKRSGPAWEMETSAIIKMNAGNVDLTERKKCPECSKCFKITVYEKHLKTHSNPRNWACNMCDKAYYHKNDLKRHVASDHVSVDCDLCSVTFTDKAQLKVHRKECAKSNKDRPSNSNIAKIEISEDKVTEDDETIEDISNSNIEVNEVNVVVEEEVETTNTSREEASIREITVEDPTNTKADTGADTSEEKVSLVLVHDIDNSQDSEVVVSVQEEQE